MPQFSRKTLLATTDLLDGTGHSHITRFLLEHSLENRVGGGSMRDRANSVARHLLENPEELDPEGRSIYDAVVEDLVAQAVRSCTRYDGFDYARFSTKYGELNRALERDGFTVEDGQLRRTLPAALDLPAADDEVHALLTQFGFEVPAGHLNQAIAAHTRGEWAAANAQLRAFTESLLDEIEAVLEGGTAPPPGHQRRQRLAEINPPFFYAELNEWLGDGKGFFQGFFRRLHPQGAHPGLSDEEDCTFRLHQVLLVARLLLRRFVARV